MKLPITITRLSLQLNYGKYHCELPLCDPPAVATHEVTFDNGELELVYVCKQHAEGIIALKDYLEKRVELVNLC